MHSDAECCPKAMEYTSEQTKAEILIGKTEKWDNSYQIIRYDFQNE